MFKADGTLVRDPAKYVSAMARSGGYKGGLFDADGVEIMEPAEFLLTLPEGGDAGAAAAGAARGEKRHHDGQALENPAKFARSSPIKVSMIKVETGPSSLFKSDGTVVRDPEKYVTAMERTGGYKGGLFDASGEEIPDPIAWLRGGTSAGSSRTARPAPVQISHDAAGSGLFKEDGTSVRDPERYVAAMDRSGGYQGGLFDSSGQEIRDPINWVRKRGGSVGSSSLANPIVVRQTTALVRQTPVLVRQTPAPCALDGSLYKTDGTPVRDPAAYVASMERSGGYKGGLFTSSGEEIRDAAAYVARMGSASTASSHMAHAAPRIALQSIGARGPPVGTGAGGSKQLFKEDGTPVRDPVAYVTAMERSGGYTGGLFNSSGEEIRDPVKYVSGVQPQASQAPLRVSTPRGAAHGSLVGMGAGNGQQLFKADGTAIRDPIAFVRNIAESGDYRGGLFNHKGEEIHDPVKYVAGMGAPSANPLSSAPCRSSPGPPQGVDDRSLFKADGTRVKNPAAYIAAFEKTGGYKGGLFNHKGQEIRDPVKYVSNMHH